MSNKITNSRLAEKITQYYAFQRIVLKSLITSGEMPLAHYQILSVLLERGQMRMGDLSDTMAISRPNLTPLVDQLVNLHYVERAASSHDRRVTYILITDIGRLALEKEKDVVVKGVSNFTAKLNDEESEKLVSALDTITELFSRI